MTPSQDLLSVFGGGLAMGCFNFYICTILIGFWIRPEARKGMRHVCGSEVLLTAGGTDLQPSIRKCASV